MINKQILGALLCFCLFVEAVPYKQVPVSSYIVENIEMPAGLTSEVGGLAFLPNGNLVACFTRGEVMIYNPQIREWKLFAEGLHDPLGILVISNSELLIMQRPELTRIKDTNGDGEADLYEKVTDDFGISGNYHEFNYGPVSDKKGNLYIALNASSSAGRIRKEVRGKINLLGRDGDDGRKQMFSAVPYRGWIMKLTPDGKLHPFASGFRSPNGIGFDLQGNLFATDNQGDWLGTSTFYHVQEGKFYGHPASLVWQKDWNKGSPFAVPVAELDNMRTKASVLFPHGIIANSPTQPVIDDTKGKFGPFSGQFLVGEMNRERIVRVMLEKVGGELQGACIPFIDNQGLRKGNNRLAFAPDGSLWVGQNSHGWLGDEGIQHITYTGVLPMDIYSMNLTADGFNLTFTQPVDSTEALKPENYTFRHYYYEYRKEYGSKQFGLANIPVKRVKLSADHKKVSLELETLEPGFIYELNLDKIKSNSGMPLANTLICYTLNKLLPSK
ncbi:hypothetical protein FW774_17950 [Pedobacter sp. BS3]|uniref:DUF7133 domain-containing protein n=1 Tax=Pedobacter sp. BS3 TaxID=2567937 RepID=UPI0011EE3F65|nr:PQQ-dependent sugar dehydrogenase [Pedobacter sp. BS3]TZF81447.1 hypothetical protein FW774_17950 [Pedobacter sp. BS3]